MTNLNFIELADPRSVPTDGVEGTYKIFLTGYSAAPNGYADPTHAYVSAMVDAKVGEGRGVTLITSPTASGQSIDAIGTTVAHEKNAALLYITGKDYLGYVNPDELPASVDKARFIAAPKFFFADNSDYSLASAVTADVLVVTGGRDVAVLDFMHALQENKPVILLDNPSLPTGFDATKNRPQNAAEYITKMIQAVAAGDALPYPTVRGLDEQFIKTNLTKISRLVCVDDVKAPRFLEAEPVAMASNGKDAGARLAANATTSTEARNDKLGG